MTTADPVAPNDALVRRFFRVAQDLVNSEIAQQVRSDPKAAAALAQLMATTPGAIFVFARIDGTSVRAVHIAKDGSRTQIFECTLRAPTAH